MKKVFQFITEILLTLLPYILVFAVATTTASIAVHNKFSLLIAVIFGSISLLTALRIAPFSFITQAAATTDGKTEVKIAVFNKLYSNNNYSAIEHIIQDINPDILGIVEIKEVDKDNLQILKDYPYRFSKANRDDATVSYYSKFPTKLIDDKKLRSTLILEVSISNAKYSILLTHPKPMISPSWFEDRDQELAEIAQIILTNQHPTILLGDLNTTPWSNSYQLLSKLEKVKNTSKGKGIQFTTTKGLVNAHIDHIFVPTSSRVNNFNVVEVAGSDHKLVWTSINL